MVTLDMVRKWKYVARTFAGHKYKIPRNEIYRIIADRFNVPIHSVRYYLDGRGAKTYNKVYQQEYKNRPEVKLRYKEQRKNYDLKYKNIVRHIDNFFPQVFDDNLELDLEEITIRIDNLVGINLGGLTLENILNKYETKARDPPLIKAESGNYQLNPSFYENP